MYNDIEFYFKEKLIHMSIQNEQVDIILLEYEEGLEKAVAHYESELQSIRAGRANPHILDKIRVDYYGTPTPLYQVSNITVVDARQIAITPWDQSLVKAIVKEIAASDIGINPADDGRIIRLNFPPLTEERRRELVKTTKKYCEDAKIACRNERRDALEKLKRMKKDSIITEDDLSGLEKDIQKSLDKTTAKIDAIIEEKEKEIMQI